MGKVDSKSSRDPYASEHLTIMKFSLFFIPALLSISGALATALPDTAEVAQRNTADLEARQTANRGSTCPDPRRAAPWFRAFNQRVVDHVYTTDNNQIRAFLRQGYRSEGTAAYIFPNQQRGTVPLFRLFSQKGTDHFYTTNVGERNKAQTQGYRSEGITGFVYTNNNCGGVPLFRLFNPSRVDHFYTTSASERDDAAKNGYNNEGTAGFVYPF